MNHQCRLVLVILLALAFAAALSAQTLGGIVGEVKDPAGAVVVGATVTATNTGTNAVRTMPTNQSGMYSFPGLVPGPYSVRVEMTGFRPAARTLEIQVQQTARVDIALEVGQLDQSVQVTAEAALLNTEDATVGTVIEQRRITELPLNGRNYLQLVALSPNVSFGFAAVAEGQSRQGGDRANQNMAIAGARATWNNYTLDGVLNTDPNFNTYVVLPSVDMLQEFKVQSGVYPAEFGRAASQINVSTRSGTNRYHGALYEFVRNDKFDARPYDFTVADHARPKNPFQWNQYGFTFGGPVQIPKVVNGKDKLFFMSNFERFRQVQRANPTYNVPSTKMRAGDFSDMTAAFQLYDPVGRAYAADGKTIIVTPFSNNTVPLARQTAHSALLLNYAPLPNSPSEAALSQPPLRNYRKTNRSTNNKDQFHLRMDWIESTSSSWFGRFSWSDEAQVNPGMFKNGSQNIAAARQYMISNTRVFSPSVFNEARFGINKLYNLVSGELAYKEDVLSQLKIPNVPAPPGVAWAVPIIESIQGLSTIGGGGDPYETRDAAFQFVDNVQIMRGKHSIRFGAELRRDRYNQFGNQFLNPAFQFNGIMTQNPNTKAVDPVLGQTGGYGLADFFLGYTNRVRYAPNPVTLQLRGTSQAYYIDEIWRVRPGLTINLGLRYEYTPPFTDRAGNLCNISLPLFVPGTKNVQDLSKHPSMVRSGTGDFYQGIAFRYQAAVSVARDGRLGPRLTDADRNDFAPRIGIAWNPSPKWSIRTGTGIFYSAEVANTRFDLGRTLGGRAEPTGPSNFPTVTMNNFLGAQGSFFTIPPGPWTWMMQKDIKNSYSFQYLLNIQHEFSQSTVLEMGYMGSVSRNLWGLYDSNEGVPAGDGSAILTRVPFPEFGIIQTVHSNARGNYNGGSFKLTRRFSSGMTALVGYTYSKSLDMVSAWRGQGDSRSANTATCYLKCEYAPSGFDTPHRMTASLLYDLPFGRGKSIGSNWGAVPNHIVGGWQLSSIVTIQSGRRGNITGGRNSLAYQDGVRPIATGQTLSLPDSQRTLDRYFNTGVAVVGDLGVIGTMGRNVLLGPGQKSWDFSALKSFRITEGHSLTFRMEAFNVANHPVFSRPGLGIGTNPAAIPVTFGQIRGTDQSMRQVQLGLKYTF